MVDALEPIASNVSAAMRRVPRHRFVPADLRRSAYEDEPLPLSHGEATISAPHMVAIQLEWAELTSGLSVLEVGTGSGYLAALVAELIRPGGSFLGIEIDPVLAEDAGRRLAELGYQEVEVRAGDGSLGAPDRAPFDRIIVSCAAPSILPAWKEQLSADGRVVAPVGGSFEQTWVRWRETVSGGRLEKGPACRFVPLKERARRHI